MVRKKLVHLGTDLTTATDDGYRQVFVEKVGGRTKFDLIGEYHDDNEGGAHLGW